MLRAQGSRPCWYLPVPFVLVVEQVRLVVAVAVEHRSAVGRLVVAPVDVVAAQLPQVASFVAWVALPWLFEILDGASSS